MPALDENATVYDHRMRRLSDKIYELRMLRDAQRPESMAHERFQTEIETLTHELVAVRQAAPTLEQLEVDMEDARRTSVRAQRHADGHMDAVWRFVKVTGGLGFLLVLAAILWPVSGWVSLAAGVLLAAAVAALVYGTRARSSRYAGMDNADGDYAALRDRRDALLAHIDNATHTPDTTTTPGDGRGGDSAGTGQQPPLMLVPTGTDAEGDS